MLNDLVSTPFPDLTGDNAQGLDQPFSPDNVTPYKPSDPGDHVGYRRFND